MSANKQLSSGYGIGAVSNMTGLTDHTIRVWERRYEAVVARRQDNGRRVYSQADVDKLTLLKVLTDQGIAISQIAGLDVEALREEAKQFREASQAPAPAEIRIAVLGDFLPLQFRESRRDLKPLDVRIANSNPQQFAADIENGAIDYVVAEAAILDAETTSDIAAWVEAAGARAGMVVYRFGKSADVERAKDAGLLVVQAPADADQIRALLMRAATERSIVGERVEKQSAQLAQGDWPVPEELPSRRFTPAQLARLSRIVSPIDCECPQQLASLVSNLAAFEIYSAQCANRNDEDAALHRYLHYTTADARARIEEALARVVEFEQLDV